MAYQGKFSQPRNTEEALARKAEAKKKEAAKAAPVKQEPVKVPQDPPVKKSEVPEVPEAPVQKPVKKQAPQNVPAKTGAKKKKKKKKKANRTITLIFYTVYFVLVAAILGGLFFLNNWLEGWLVNYEASQPTTRCEEIFQENFASPDWAKLYQMAGLSDTEYEGSDAFAAYMADKVGGQALTYVETSAGLSGGHKYLLKLGDETLGYFTLVDQAPEGSDIADWQLGKVSLSYAYGEAVTIQRVGDVTVYVNGVALTDDHTIQIGTTLSEDYLPEGVHGPRIYTHYLEGLMVTPEVTAVDADGNPVDVSFNAETGIYTVQTEENTISEEEYERVLKTAKTYALRMIEKASAQELAKYFDSKSETYKTIISIDPWMQEWFFRSYEWGEESITGYYRHSDSLFSVHVELPMLVTRTDDTVKEYKIDHSFFFEKKNGTWKCVTMTNVDIRKQTASVRLTFKSDDNVIFTNMFAEDISTLELPTVTAPEGQVFTGWYRLDTAADGTRSYTRIFAPEDGDVITLPAGTKLEPMTLYALFEAAE
ncbi:MAG: hypothetical protein E7465_07250 [Ruminococcaceae bacterium]|nr:hypothetical protein [Oscillospiraceae bacterium]